MLSIPTKIYFLSFTNKHSEEALFHFMPLQCIEMGIRKKKTF